METHHFDHPRNQPNQAARLQRELLAKADFQAVLATPEGRRFVRRVLAESGVHQASFAADGLLMAYREGRRSLGLWLQGLFMDFPDQYLQLLKEGAYDTDQ